MFPHVAKAMDIVKERKRQREAKHRESRRIYVRSLLLGELPVGGPAALADAVEDLAIDETDFDRDVSAASSSRKLTEELSSICENSKTTLAAAKAEDPRWHPACDPDDFPSAGPAIQAAQRALEQNAGRSESIQKTLRELHRRCPRLFSDDTFSLLQPPTIEQPTQPHPARFQADTPEVANTDDEDADDYAAQPPTGNSRLAIPVTGPAPESAPPTAANPPITAPSAIENWS